MITEFNHIVLISLDNLRGDCIGKNKYKYLPKEIRFKYQDKKNYLDKLAEKGLHFTKCFTAAPYTTASHASILTGFYPKNHGLYEYYNSEIKKNTLFEYAKRSGWKTMLHTDFPIILNKALGFERGVDRYLIENEKEALKIINNNVHNKTLSLIHFGGIHYPYGFHKIKFGGENYRKKVENLEREEKINHSLPKDQLDETFRNEEDTNLLLRYKNIIESLYKKKDYRKLTLLYLEGIDYFITNRFKPFFEELLQILNNEKCLIVIFGDHGEEWSETSEGHYKSLSYGVLNVPLLFLGKKITPKVVYDNVRTIDIVPTLIKFIDPLNKEIFDGTAISFQNLRILKSEKRISIAQTWLGFGKDNLKKHISRTVKDGKIKRKMKTIKRGESSIIEDFQFLKYFDKTSEVTFNEFLSYSPRRISKGIKAMLKNSLIEYNKVLKQEKKILKIDKKIKEELQLLGYKI